MLGIIISLSASCFPNASAGRNGLVGGQQRDSSMDGDFVATFSEAGIQMMVMMREKSERETKRTTQNVIMQDKQNHT